MPRESQAERRVWNLLMGDFDWEVPYDFPVAVEGAPSGTATLQIFEVVTAAIFAHLAPEYRWTVTPNRADDGADFIGRGRFGNHDILRGAPVITIGGQCKIRARVKGLVDELSGSLTNMAATINPTFFVVALSARVGRKTVDKARRRFEYLHRRDCYILDRQEIEALIRDHLFAVDEILRQSLSPEAVGEVLDYFGTPLPRQSTALTAVRPDKIFAGVPFNVMVTVRSSLAAAPAARLWWRPGAPDQCTRPITLLDPVGIDGPQGVELSDEASNDPLQARHSVELVSYSVGRVDLGTLLVGFAGDGASGAVERIKLGVVEVAANVRPRFFRRPFRDALKQLADEYDHALAEGVTSIGVVGAGGSGKSRLCEEFALERRRQGAGVVSARHAKVVGDPYELLADVFLQLIAGELSYLALADRVIGAIERYDRALARRAEPTLRWMFRLGDDGTANVVYDDILSCLWVLIGSRRAPLIIHLQDLHWAGADLLQLLERLVSLLDPGAQDLTTSAVSKVLFIFEGRIGEREEGAWNSAPFEAFLQKRGCTLVRCSAFDRADRREFIRSLFEDPYVDRRRVRTPLLDLQHELIERIDAHAGGNPFHSLEQVRLFQQKGVLGQNPETGLLYLIQPTFDAVHLPDSVFELIRLRWQDLKARAPELALLLWAIALLQDRLPAVLFRRLSDELSPSVDPADIDATEMLWTGNIDVAFRHENYVSSLRKLQVSPHERERVVAAYSAWYAGMSQLTPADRFTWARVVLELPEPDVGRAHTLLTTALRGARRSGDLPLARRIRGARLDLVWAEDARSRVRVKSFLRQCDEELALIGELLGSDRATARERLDQLRDRLGCRLSSGRSRSTHNRRELRRRELAAEVLRSSVLFNDRQPGTARDIAASAVRRIKDERRRASSEESPAWEALEMKALHAEAVALALSGEVEQALVTSQKAVALAGRALSPESNDVISTYANILLASDPDASESILRKCLEALPEAPEADGARDATEINLSMALVLRAARLRWADGEDPRALLDEAGERLERVFSDAVELARFPDAGAAALMRGIVSALRDERNEAYWFAKAVAAASRGRQMETLWRAHINLATAFYRMADVADRSVRDHAHAALEIMEQTLATHPQPDRSARFKLLAVPMAHAVRFLVLAADDAGPSALRRYPALRECFEDMRAGILREDRGGYQSHEWIKIENDEYVIY